jgi:hypothetical protein
MKTQLQLGNIGRHKTIEWNVSRALNIWFSFVQSDQKEPP